MGFGFGGCCVAVIPAQGGREGRVRGFGALDSRLRGNDGGEKGNSLAKCDCPDLEGRYSACLPQIGSRAPVRGVEGATIPALLLRSESRIYAKDVYVNYH